MRSISLWAALVLLVGGSVFGQQSVTVKGVTYIGAELIKEYPQSVFVSHATGKSFLNKADLSSDDAQALGITSPVVDPFQQALDKDFHDLQSGKGYVPAAPPPPARTSSTPPPPQRIVAPRSTPHPSSIAAVQQEFSEFVERKSLPQSSAGSADPRRAQETALPDQPWMGNFDASTVRIAMFKRGLLPLKESEARDLFSGRGVSSMSSRCALDAVKAAKVMLGQLGPEHLPLPYKEVLRRSAPPAARAPVATARRTTSVPFDPSIFPAGTVSPSVPAGASTFAAGAAPIHAHPVASAGGDPHVHRMWHGADGSSATQQGNVLFHSDGRISHGAFPAGGQFNTFHSSDGSVHHQSGNAMFPAGGGAGMFGAP
jgi:hypothetical protein